MTAIAGDDAIYGVQAQAGPQSILLAAADIEEVFFGGALGAGKSLGLALDFQRHHQQNGAITGIAFRMSVPQLDDLIGKFKEVLEPAGFEWKVGRKTFQHPDGSVLRMRHLEKAADASLYWGHEYQWLGVDELGDMPEATCLAIQKLRAARLRSAKGQKIRSVATGNPCGAGHKYCYERYIKPAPPFTPFTAPTSGHSMIYIPGRMESNILLLQNDPKYRQRCQDLGPQWYVDALVNGDWSKSPEGNMFQREHFANTYDPLNLPRFLFIAVSWDTAFKTTRESARSACTVWGLTQNAFYLLYAWAKKVTFPELKRKAEDVHGTWNANETWIEDKASGQSLDQSLREDTTMPVRSIKVDGDKLRRAFAVTPWFDGGKILVPTTAPWKNEYIEEMCAFPAPTGYNDYVDSSSQGVMQMAKIKKRWERHQTGKVIPISGTIFQR